MNIFILLRTAYKLRKIKLNQFKNDEALRSMIGTSCHNYFLSCSYSESIFMMKPCQLYSSFKVVSPTDSLFVSIIQLLLYLVSAICCVSAIND